MNTDKELRQAVMDELAFEPSITATDIGVTVKDGVVTLMGTVSSFAEKWSAERAAERVSRMRALAKDLSVAVPGSHQRSDSEIAAAALQALRWDVQVPDTRVKLEVENGLVTLKGEFDWNYQRQAADRDMRNLSGVRGVFNQITLKPTASPKEVSAKISAALQRTAVKDARSIQVETHGGKVTLRGQVHSWAEREDAERAAWQAPGVTAVEDNIWIQP